MKESHLKYILQIEMDILIWWATLLLLCCINLHSTDQMTGGFNKIMKFYLCKMQEQLSVSIKMYNLF